VDNQKDIADWNEDAELKKLGIAYAKATAEWLEMEPMETGTLYRVQVGAYRDQENAEAMRKRLEAAGFEGIIVPVTQ